MAPGLWWSRVVITNRCTALAASAALFNIQPVSGDRRHSLYFPRTREWASYRNNAKHQHDWSSAGRLISRICGSLGQSCRKWFKENWFPCPVSIPRREEFLQHCLPHLSLKSQCSSRTVLLPLMLNVRPSREKPGRTLRKGLLICPSYIPVVLSKLPPFFQKYLFTNISFLSQGNEIMTKEIDSLLPT